MADEDIINTGRDSSGRFVSKSQVLQSAQNVLAKAKAEASRAQQSIDKLKAAYGALQKQVKSMVKAQSSGWKSAEKQCAKTMAAQTKAMGKFYKQIEKMRRADQKLQAKVYRQQLKDFKRLANEKIKAARAGSGRGGMGFGGLGIGLGSVISVAAIYGAVRKFLSMSTPLLQAEINQRGSVAAIRAAQASINNLAPSDMAGLLTKYQGLGAAQFFGGDRAAKGLFRLQSELAKGAGVERASQMVEDLAKSYGDATDRLQAFLEAAGTGNIQQVLQQFASGENIVQTTQALNALGIASDGSKGKIDPMVEAERKLTETMDRLNATLERFVSDMLPKLLPYLEKGADLIDEWATRLSKLDASTLAILAGGVVLGPSMLRGGARLAGRGLARGAIGLGRGALGLVGTGAGATAGAALAAGASVGFMGHQLYKVYKGDTRETVGGKLADKLWGYKDGAKVFVGDPEIMAAVAAKRAAREAREQAERSKPAHQSLWATITEGAKSAWEWTSKYTNKLKDVAAKSRVQQLQEQARQRDQAKLNTEVAGSETDLARARLALARTNFFGPQMGLMSSVPEFQSLQKTISDEIGRLHKYLGTIDESTEKGAIESNRIKTQILNLRREEKAGLVELLQGLNPLDSIAAQAMGAGRFEKFIVTGSRNKRRGLELGMVKANPLVGSLTGPIAMPYRLSPSIGTSIHDLNRYSQQIQAMTPPQIRAMLPESSMAHDLAGARAMGSGPSVQSVGSSSNKVDQLKEIRGGFDRLIQMEEGDRPQRQARPQRVSSH